MRTGRSRWYRPSPARAAGPWRCARMSAPKTMSRRCSAGPRTRWGRSPRWSTTPVPPPSRRTSRSSTNDDVRLRTVRVEDLRDIEEIKQLRASYTRYGDTQQWSALANLFTEDFEFICDVMPRRSRDSPLSAHSKGRDAFIRDMNELVDGRKTVHHMYSPEITLLGPTTATGIWAMTDWVQMPEGLFQGWGHYHEKYEKIDGVWKISKTHCARIRPEERWS